MSLLQNSNAISAGGYDVNNSVRLRSSASAYLSRTPASAGNRKTWTWSGWVKRGALGISGTIVTSRQNGQTDWLTTAFTSSDTLQVCRSNGGTYNLVTTQVFRDPSAWYHIVIAWDTTQATAANRVKLYINGNQVTAFGTANYPTLNYDGYFNTAVEQEMGAVWAVSSVTDYFDGYLADVNFIDGSAKTPSDFGETDATTGVWKPKAYASTYGTNGFYLKFSDIATTSGSNAGLGKDFSGNGNYWTTNNISVTSGTTYDAMKDSPTNTSATVANYATLNPLLRLNGIVGTFTNGNLNFLAPTAADYYYCSTMFTGTTGKYYSEATINAIGSGILIGLINEAQVGTAWGNKSAYRETGAIYDLSGTAVTSGSTYTTGDVIGIAVDVGAGTVQFYKNNVAQGATPSFSFTAGTPLAFAGRSNNANADVAFNFGQRPFSYTPPTGFVALNTYNLPDSTIVKGNTVMDATLYTGTGATQVVTNAGAFKPDLIWLKQRGVVGNHGLYDSIRGISYRLISNLTNAEASVPLDSFNTNGFTTTSNYNNSGETIVAWQWQAGQGSTSSNTSGSITSTVSVNTTAGFSVVTYTGTGTAATVGHGLGVAPKMVIIKQRNSTSDWTVYTTAVDGSLDFLYLNLTSAKGDSGLSLPTSTVFSLGTGTDTNGSGSTYVAYCWADVSGYSKAFSYTGNGSTDGVFTYLGFRPKFIMIKRTDAVESWEIFDTSRSSYNTAVELLEANSSGVESTSAGNAIDILSNGFKQRNTRAATNASGGTYIYMAFAESPFKSSLAR